MHAETGRRRGRPRSRILYWFRTPPDVRIGRAALDEDAIRLIEEHNPDVEFDWTRILKGQDAPIESKPLPPDRRGKPRPREFPPRPQPPPAAVEPSVEPAAAPEQPADTFPDAREETLERRDEPFQQDESIQPIDDRVDQAAIDELLSDAPPGPGPGEPVAAPPSSAMVRLGSEGLSRLRARHSEVMARISETVTDPVRRDELKSQADRLNPDTWVTDAEVSAGLESYETVFESLRTVIGRRRRRRKRSGGSTRQAPTVAAPGEGPSFSDSEDGEPADAQEPGEDL